jgi:pantoate--beta-alanine ligase
MLVFKTIDETKNHINKVTQTKSSLGFVPTMGALHKGHISLIEASKKQNEITACSIFVNPIQFNNKSDFEKYPLTLERDIELLEAAGCDILFAPTAKEMYPEPANEKYDFGQLETAMEGAMRPGHFNGVAIVVKKLFEIISPNRAYFGEKDYQQLLIIKALINQLGLAVEIVPCPILRDADGLAMSSRNKRLTKEQRKIAPEIYNILSGSLKLKNILTPKEIKKILVDQINAVKQFKIEYFEIADGEELQPLTNWNSSVCPMGFIAVYMEEIRLIDNVKYF